MRPTSLWWVARAAFVSVPLFCLESSSNLGIKKLGKVSGQVHSTALPTTGPRLGEYIISEKTIRCHITASSIYLTITWNGRCTLIVTSILQALQTCLWPRQQKLSTPLNSWLDLIFCWLVRSMFIRYRNQSNFILCHSQISKYMKFERRGYRHWQTRFYRDVSTEKESRSHNLMWTQSWNMRHAARANNRRRAQIWYAWAVPLMGETVWLKKMYSCIHKRTFLFS